MNKPYTDGPRGRNVGQWPGSTFFLVIAALAMPLFAQQPKVGTTKDEPPWPQLLAGLWDLDMDRDLRNPRIEGMAPAALFQKADQKKPVTCRPLIALGMPNTTRGGWYAAGPRAGDLPKDLAAVKRELWSFTFKQSQEECKTLRFSAPPLAAGEATFEPGDKIFGLWVSNDNFQEPGVFTQPALVARENPRLGRQPYKAMIYPAVDEKTKKLVPNGYLIGWEYSNNDDFQDVVLRIDNVRLLPGDPPLSGILAAEAKVVKLAGGFKFVEGPAWDFKNNALFFSDIPAGQILRYADGKATVAREPSGLANGLMFDKQGRLLACEGAGKGGHRRVSRTGPGGEIQSVAERCQGTRFNSPNDLWLDTAGGAYFTDPQYGPRELFDMDEQDVYYVSADGTVRRLITELVKPNGIALAPDGKCLYVLDNGADLLYRYPIIAAGQIGQGKRIARVNYPDGMTVDARGRLYLAAAGGIWVLQPGGQWLGLIETPEQPSNCTFGGPGWRTLFITARTGLYAVETQTRGWHVHLDGQPPS